MYRIIEGRGTGKTSRLMLLAKEHNGTIICANPYAMREKAHAYGLTGFDIVSYIDFVDGNYDTTKPYFIDELEVFMKTIFDMNFEGYTLSLDD